MTVFDTNVLSELLKRDPSSFVTQYIDRTMTLLPYITVITAAELRFGYAQIPIGRRRQQLAEHVEHLLTDTFANRIIPFDADASQHYATLAARCRADGRPMPLFDSLIAAIVLSRGATLVTRNTKDFAFCQVPLVNPWEQNLPE